MRKSTEVKETLKERLREKGREGERKRERVQNTKERVALVFSVLYEK